MRIERVMAVISKEWREILRDRLFFLLAFIVPTALMLLFGFGLSLDVEGIPLAVVDHDMSPVSRDYAHRFIDSRYFDFRGYSRDEREVDRLLTQNSLRAVIIIPPQFQRNLASGVPAHVQTIIDGTFPYRANATKGYVIAINRAANQELLSAHLARKRGAAIGEAEEALRPVRLEVRYLYNQNVKSIWSLAPKLIMVILMICPPFLTSLGIVREKETGSIYNIYASTVTKGEFLLGKLTPYVLIATANAVILWGLATELFLAPFKGNFIFFLASSLLYVICTTGIGLVISTFVRTQMAAVIAATILTIIPAVLYSGGLIPVPSLTRAAQVIAHFLPTMYFTNIVLGVFLKGVGIAALWTDVVVLALYSVILFTTGYFFFSKRPSS